MKHSLIPIIAALVLMTACSDNNKDDDTGQTQSALCLTFVDQAVESYASTWWDTNHDHCIDKTEAAAVTQIPALAFVNNTQIRSLDDLNQFPNLTAIGNGAFSGCTGLTSANVPNVTTIGDSAFAGCTGLTTVNAPNATSIGNEAFSGCSSLVKVNVPAQDPPAPQCTDGDRKCSDSGMHAFICVNQKWAVWDNCTKGCTNGTCNPAEVTCPSSCTNGCNADGSCKPAEVMCPSSCTNGCNADGTCKPAEVTCPSTCTHGCNDDGSCKPAEVTCPSSCTNGCNADGTCSCPSSCKNGCNADGSCKPAEVTCPSSCTNGCDDKGNCIEVGQPCDSDEECQYGCNLDSETCNPRPACLGDFPTDGSYFDCGECTLQEMPYINVGSVINVSNIRYMEMWNLGNKKASDYCNAGAGNVALCRWADGALSASCLTPCAAGEQGKEVLWHYEEPYAINNDIDGEIGTDCDSSAYYGHYSVVMNKCSYSHGQYIYLNQGYVCDSTEDDLLPFKCYNKFGAICDDYYFIYVSDIADHGGYPDYRKSFDDTGKAKCTVDSRMTAKDLLSPLGQYKESMEDWYFRCIRLGGYTVWEPWRCVNGVDAQGYCKKPLNVGCPDLCIGGCDEEGRCLCDEYDSNGHCIACDHETGECMGYLGECNGNVSFGGCGCLMGQYECYLPECYYYWDKTACGIGE